MRPFELRGKERLPPLELRDKRELQRYRVFTVEQQTLARPGGAPIRDVYTMGVRDWVNVLALTEDDELVLVWQLRFGPGEVTLETPGGVVEPGESPWDTARRELLEETGYEAGALELLCVTEPNPALHGNRCHAFLARGCRRVGEPHGDPDEEVVVELVGAEHAERLLDENWLRHALCRVTVLEWLRRR